MTIYNLSYKATVKDINNLIGEFGRIDEILIPRNIEGYPHGYAFVYLHSEKDIQRVLDYADERHIHNRQIRILKYEKDTKKNQREIRQGKHSSQREGIYADSKVFNKFNYKNEKDDDVFKFQ